MDTKIIVTPNNFTITLKNDLTYGEYEDLQSLMGQNIKIDPVTGKPQSVDFNIIKEANKKAFDLLIVKIEKDGQPFNGSFRDLPSRDGKAIQAEIDAIMKDTGVKDSEEEAKKKAI